MMDLKKNVTMYFSNNKRTKSRKKFGIIALLKNVSKDRQ